MISVSPLTHPQSPSPSSLSYEFKRSIPGIEYVKYW